MVTRNLKRKFSLKSVNKVVLYLTYADILVLGSWSLVTPFIAVFMTDQLVDGSIAVAGFATTISLLTRSLAQLPIARYLDVKKGEKDDFYTINIGLFLIAISALMFVFAETSLHVYVIHFVNGLGVAFYMAAFMSIFTRHLDKNEEAVEWAFDDTAVGLSSALCAGLAGLLITYYSYTVLFAITFVVSILSMIFTILIKKDLSYSSNPKTKEPQKTKPVKTKRKSIS